MHEVVIEKLVHGGQGIATLPDGRKVFVWNALPGERVLVRLTKNKHKLAEGIAEEILEPSKDRLVPRDEAYLSTSPWQIMSFAAENMHKLDILRETMQREHVEFDAKNITFTAQEPEWQYRNKMEYSFWADDLGLHIALFNRGTHAKQIVPGSSIAMPAIDEVAHKILVVLKAAGIRGSQLKTVVIRSDQQGECVAALYVKDQAFPDLPGLQNVCKGVAVYYSNPKSPASVLTKQLYIYGDITLTDTILDHPICYDVNSFFQVNLGIFKQALKSIQEHVAGKPYIDMYSGVGTIGLSIGGAGMLIEADKHNCEMARQNAAGTNIQIVESTVESALEYIDDVHALIVDPPRAGLHKAVVEQILAKLPPKIIYLSCNPITQARDIALLQDTYHIESIQGYNFFPKTPHIESLAVLTTN